MLSVARPYSLHALTGTSTGLCLTERWYLAPGLPRSPRALRWTRRRSSIVPRPTPQSGTDTASGQINWSDSHSAESPGRAPPCSKNRPWAMLGETGAQTGTRKGSRCGRCACDRDRSPDRTPVSDRGVTVGAALVSLQPKVRLVLSFCGLVLVIVAGALFAFAMYRGETLLFLGVGAGIAGTAWGYMQVTAWLARRTASAITLSDSASERGSQS